MADMRMSRRSLFGGAAAAGVAVAAGAGSATAADRPSRATSTRRREADVVVVGAGLAGLAAARDVQRAGKSVVVLEARDRVGGRTLNHPLPGGHVGDIGGTWIGPTQDRIAALATSVGVHAFAQPDDGKQVYYAQGRKMTYRDTGPLGTAPPDPTILADVALVVKLLDKMAKQVPVGRPWESAHADEWDRITLDTWLRENTTNNETLRVAQGALEALVGAEARELSLLFTVAYVARATNGSAPGTFERLINTRGGAQAKRFVEGAQEISLRVAAALGDSVVLASPARTISQDANGVVVHSDLARVRAKQAIVAVPPTLAGRIDYTPALPWGRDQLTQRFAQGALIKVGAYYDKPWWREEGLTGAAVSDTGPARITFDVSTADGSVGGLLGFVGGDEARAYAGRSDALLSAVLDNFATYFGPRALNPIETVVMNWADELWSRGCPTAIGGPGLLSEYGPAISAPIGRIHWAGTETATYWQGYMDGAVRSGERAAAEVLSAL
ncbi:MAG: flavin monoamine oxidase family protein [Actinomycetes bacterium]